MVQEVAQKMIFLPKSKQHIFLVAPTKSTLSLFRSLSSTTSDTIFVIISLDPAFNFIIIVTCQLVFLISPDMA